jgi:hypothetical protein
MAKKRQAVRRKKQGPGWPVTMIIIGAVGVIMGAVFIYQGAAKSDLLKNAMRQEKITLTFVPGAPQNEIIDSAKTAMIAGDTIREHRREIAPTYEALLGGKKFDPNNPKDLTYAQALNMENYLYLAVVGFGLTQLATASGVFMIIMGIAIGGTGIQQYRLTL